ncbi:glutathione transferase [Apiospora saccharicola]
MASNPPKPIRVWLTPPGPNPWKVIFLLEELGLNYEIKSFSFEVVKKKPFTDVNPNGRVPAIEDPNTDLTLWESGAIIQYLVETYDGEKHHVSHAAFRGRQLCNQWLHFQMSGQGPYYGQCGWFQHLHYEKYQPAIDRYAGEIRRVLGVLEGELAARPADAPWLVGGKMTFADMAFVSWNFRLSEVLNQPWDQRMVELPSWKRAMEVRARLMDEQGLQWNGVPKGIETFTEYEEQIAAAKDEKA